jgi:hypothetical protein
MYEENCLTKTEREIVIVIETHTETERGEYGVYPADRE